MAVHWPLPRNFASASALSALLKCVTGTMTHRVRWAIRMSGLSLAITLSVSLYLMPEKKWPTGSIETMSACRSPISSSSCSSCLG